MNGTGEVVTASIEMEASLVICAADPEAVAEDLARLGQIGDYVFQSRGTKRIRDIYFDTPDWALAARMLSLRLREENGVMKATLKGEKTTRQNAATADMKVRSELEQRWKDGALAAIMFELQRQGIHLSGTPTLAVERERTGDPFAMLQELGLVAIQERVTHRILRGIRSVSAPDATLATMTIDAVSFRLPGQEVRHFEVEIEHMAEGTASADTSAQVIRQISRELLATFTGKLRPWSIPKLAFGLKLESLLREGRLERMTRGDGTLLPEAYDLIAATMS